MNASDTSFAILLFTALFGSTVQFSFLRPTAALCGQPNLRQILGTRCNPFLLGNVNCVVGQWTSWQRVSTSAGHSGCSNGQQPRYYTKTRRIITFPRGNGKPCPSQKDQKTHCQSSGTATSMQKVLSNIGGFGPQGGKTPPVAPPVAPPPVAPPVAYKVHLTFVNRTVQSGRFLQPRYKRQAASCPDDRDLAIVIDGSGSVGGHHFKQAVTVLGDLISHMCGFQDDTIHCGSTRVAIVTYSTTAKVVFDLNFSKNRHHSRINVMNDIAHRPTYPGGLTATGDALQLVNDRVFQTYNGMRYYSKKSVLLLTDGHSNRGQNAAAAAKKLYNRFGSANFNILALGIGSGINYNELLDITMHSNPNNPFFLALKNYIDFKTAVEYILSLLSSGQSTCNKSGGSTLLDRKRR